MKNFIIIEVKDYYIKTRQKAMVSTVYTTDKENAVNEFKKEHPEVATYIVVAERI